MNKILIIEDDKSKIEKLSVFFSSDELIIKESFQGGMVELRANWRTFKFLFLDMTIPLWEKDKNDLGGNYEQFGGEKVLREMRRKDLLVPTILFTMFDVFPTSEGNLTFSQIDNHFRKEFPTFYVGAVFYAANSDNWKQDITNLITEIDGSDKYTNS